MIYSDKYLLADVLMKQYGKKKRKKKKEKKKEISGYSYTFVLIRIFD